MSHRLLFHNIFYQYRLYPPLLRTSTKVGSTALVFCIFREFSGENRDYIMRAI